MGRLVGPVTAPSAATTPRGRAVSALRVVGPAVTMIVVALCLRGPFSAVAPLIASLRQEYGVSTGAVAVLTALPLVGFAALSPVAPALARRVGVHRAVLLAAAALGAGVAVRLGGVAGLFAGTVLLAGGIAVVNVLLPALVRAEYGPRAPAVLGATTGAIALSASLGAGFAQPVADSTGSARASLVLWLAPVALAWVGLAALTLRRHVRTTSEQPRPPTRFILRDRVAQVVALYFGLQSLSFYAMLTWLPTLLQDEAGLSPAAAGGLLAVSAGLGAPASLLVPARAARTADQTRWVVAVTVPTAVAIVGLLVAPASAPVLWALLYGLGTGAAFPLAMVLMLLRTGDVAQTGRLSAAAQSSGYLLAAAGPLGIGLLYGATGGWTAGLVVLFAVLVAQLASGLAAARPRRVTDT